MATSSFDKQFIVTDESIITEVKSQLGDEDFEDLSTSPWEDGSLGREAEFVNTVTLPEELVQRMLKVAKGKIEQ